jgi:transposase-like protein
MNNINTSHVINLGYFKSKLITDIKTKNFIINFIYSNINVYNYRYKIIDSIDILENIKKNTDNFYIIPHFQGYNFFIIFTRYNDLNLCVLIDKKNIKYKKEQINLRDINMYQLNVKCNNSLFKNTFIDGRIIRKNEDNIFLLQDCYLLENEKLLTERMTSKMELIDKILIEKFYDNNLKINVIKFYKIDQIIEISEKMKTTEYVINGFIFVPSRSGINYIYVNNHEVDLLKNELPIAINKYDNNTFIIKKTLMREVFDVIDIESQKRLGICYIPNIIKSHYMRQLFKDKIFHKMKCNYNEQFKKYEPVELVD